MTMNVIEAQHIPERTYADMQRDLTFAQTQLQEYWRLYSHWRDVFKNTLKEMEDYDAK